MSSLRLLALTDATFPEQVDRAELPVLVAFTSADCGVCRAMAPRLEALAAELEGAAQVATCDVPGNPAAVQRVELRRLPTLALFHRGALVGQLAGLVPDARLRALIGRVLPAA